MTILENIREAWFFSNECELLTNKVINTLNWFRFINEKKKYLLYYIIINNILLIIMWETWAVKERIKKRIFKWSCKIIECKVEFIQSCVSFIPYQICLYFSN